MKIKKTLLLLLFFGLPVFSRGQVLSSAASALQSMNVATGAKATALGGAFSSVADDTSAVYWNPAGMSWMPSLEIQTTYNQWFLDTFFQDLGAVLPASWGVVGARISYINFGQFDVRDQNGVDQGTETADAWAGALAASARLDDLSFGLSLKGDEESFTGYSLGGLGVDAGALWRKDRLSLAGGVRNVGGAAGYGLPTEFYGGGSVLLGPPGSTFLLATDVVFPSGSMEFHHGVEWAYHQALFLRAGYQWVTEPLEDQDEAGFSGGVGVKLADFTLDYSIVSYGDLGITNKVAVGYQFESASPTPSATPRPLPLATPVASPEATETPTPVLKKPEAALTTATPPVRVEAEASSAPGESMKALYKKGVGFFKAGKFKAAALNFHKAVKIQDPTVEHFYYAEAYAMLGVIYQYHAKFDGHLDSARKYYQEALKWEAANATALKHLKELGNATE